MHKPQTWIQSAIGYCCMVGSAIVVAPAAAAQEGSRTLEEIVVTAQKRSATLAEIPMSITVLTGESLERQRIENFQDLLTQIPGFSLESNRPGVSRITLRGINTGGVASTIGVYLDEVPFGSSSGLANAAVLSADFDTFDLDRLEVLRGPQGTLYGASSLGGVMKYVTRQPDTDAFEARVRASVDSVEEGSTGYAFNGMANVPLGDRAAVRATGFFRHEPGFIDSVGSNPIASLTDPSVNVVEGTRVEDGVNDVDTFGGRISGLLHVTDNLSATFRAQAQNIESDSSSLIDADPASLEPAGGGYVGSRYHSDWSDVEYRVYSADLDWDLGAVSLQSITSYATLEQEFVADLAANTELAGVPMASLATLLFGDAAARPLSVIQQQTVSTDKFTQELRLVSNQERAFEWLLGLYYTDEKSDIEPQDFLAVEAGTDQPAAGVPVLATAAINSDYEEIAVFADTTWHVTERLELSLGARLSDNEQTASQALEGPLVGGSVNFENASSSESPFTYSVAPRFEVSDNVSVYARVATGYRPGGPNIIPIGAPPGTPGSYDSDELTNYEVGFKASLPDLNVDLDVAAFYLDWDDVQLFAFVNGVGLNANGGTAVSKGAELAATLHPVDNLTLAVNAAYTDAYLTEDTDPVVGGSDGDALPYVPEWSFGASADYGWDVGGAWAYVGATLGYVGDRPAAFNNLGPDGRTRELDSYTTLGLRAGIEFDRWSIEAYGRNVTDEDGITDIADAGSLPNGLVGLGLIRPRTLGLSIVARL